MLTTPKGQVLVNSHFITQSVQGTGKKLKKATVRPQIPINKLLVLASVVSNNRDRLEEAKRIQKQQWKAQSQQRPWLPPMVRARLENLDLSHCPAGMDQC